MGHILIGKNLVLKVDQIESALLEETDDNGKPCIKVKMVSNIEWTIWANLEYSKGALKSIARINDQFDLLENIKGCVLKNRKGRESKVSKEIQELLNK
jgi:hypothetical protein